MIILTELPPIIREAQKAFPGMNPMMTVFTYGKYIYNPGGHNISEDLLIHEETHMNQQNDPKSWWYEYLHDKDFRLEQELEAYNNQYEFYENIEHDRNNRAKFLSKIASDLSGDMYGRMIEYKDALDKIKNYGKPV